MIADVTGKLLNLSGEERKTGSSNHLFIDKATGRLWSVSKKQILFHNAAVQVEFTQNNYGVGEASRLKNFLLIPVGKIPVGFDNWHATRLEGNYEIGTDYINAKSNVTVSPSIVNIEYTGLSLGNLELTYEAIADADFAVNEEANSLARVMPTGPSLPSYPYEYCSIFLQKRLSRRPKHLIQLAYEGNDKDLIAFNHTTVIDPILAQHWYSFKLTVDDLDVKFYVDSILIQSTPREEM